MKTHLMVDIETLAQANNAAVISIGACSFNNTGILNTFKVNIKPESAKAFGMVVCKDTLAWWGKQSEAARQAALSHNVMADFGLKQFVDWYKEQKPGYVWAHGVSFDTVILENAFKAVSVDCPWKYSQVMDTRTVFNMFGIYTKDLHSTTGDTHHDALDDAKTQANALIAMLNAMSWGEPDSPIRI